VKIKLKILDIVERKGNREGDSKKKKADEGRTNRSTLASDKDPLFDKHGRK